MQTETEVQWGKKSLLLAKFQGAVPALNSTLLSIELSCLGVRLQNCLKHGENSVQGFLKVSML